MGVYIRSSQLWCEGLSGYQQGVYPFVCPLRAGIVYIRAQSPIVFQRHISGTCLFLHMYRGCVFFHFRLHLSAIVPRSPTWIVIYVLLGRDICSPADYTTSPPSPFRFSVSITPCLYRCVRHTLPILLLGVYPVVFLRCLTSLRQGAFFTTSQSPHCCAAFTTACCFLTLLYHLSYSMLVALPFQLAHRRITCTVIDAYAYPYVPSCHAVITH